MEAIKQQSKVESLRLVDQLLLLAETQGLTELEKKSHIAWILRFIKYQNNRHLCELGKLEVESYLSYLATELNFDTTAQQAAKKALLFLFQEFLNVTLGDLHFLRLKQRRGFFSRFGEFHCRQVIKRLSGTTQLMAKLALNANIKLQEITSLRISDVNLKKSQLVIRDAKGHIKYTANIPVSLILDLRIQIMKVRALVQQEKERALGESYSELSILARGLEPEWQYLFPFCQSKNKAKQLNQMPLNIFKSDLKLAIENYFRFLPDEQVKAAIKMPNNILSYSQSAVIKPGQVKIKRPVRQKSFNFSDELGVA